MPETGVAPPIRYIQLTPQELADARTFAQRRYERGAHTELDNGADMLATEIASAMTELAVCRYYGEDYREWLVDAKPGPLPDLIHRGYRVSIKGRQRWELPLDLIVPSYDVHSDIYILVSVTASEGLCGLRGWIRRSELLRYPCDPYRWRDDKPGARRNKTWRYVPVEDLHPCRELGSRAA